ncbi:hypothetical protein H6G17_24865 [Chroococcidiopsis sp. FACHB-1243]|uniref:hypothetical protein n=1 Tax=Chroococcidiopsis sp. [FACHB-1243] TaxID=2692781 RepID=UPI0017849E70|nr:hypothetical protein [Chroococcidiopsis sp. [FACHB-1243]]MBD2308706.1 hypothetical protein [Chroococcidiopsis sp. [FACHB-1243]]
MLYTYSRSSAFFNNLAALLAGQLFLPEDAAYEQVRQLWNGKVKTQPTAINGNTIRMMSFVQRPDISH